MARKLSKLVAQRKVSCPQCDAKPGDPCRAYINRQLFTYGDAVNYNHVTRIRKYEREKDSL